MSQPPHHQTQPNGGPSGSRSNPPPVPRSSLFTFFPPRSDWQQTEQTPPTRSDTPPSGAPPGDDPSSRSTASGHEEAVASDRPPPVPPATDAAPNSTFPNLNIPFPPMFVMRPDGSVGLGHNFLPPPVTAPSDDASSTATQPSDNGVPPQSPRPWPFLSPHFHFFVNMPPPEAQPDPAKAAELLKSLPDISKALLQRVNRILAAEENESDEDECGWKCGICLEGMQEGDDDNIGIKGLPCNHLFHAKCIEPWFATKHTCPTCRLDLDPLKTLIASDESRRNPLRPSQTGADRQDNSHPYDRPASAARPTAPDLDASFTVIWRMVTPQTQSNIGAVEATPVAPQTASAEQGTSTPTPSSSPFPQPTPTATPPSLPRPMFGSFMHTSPIPMERSISAPPPPLVSDSPSPGPLDPARPVPERRQHITVIRQGGPAQVMHDGTQLHPSANPLHHHHHIVTHHHHHHHHHHHAVQQPSRTPTATQPPPPTLPAEQPTVHFFFNHGPGSNTPQVHPDPATEPKKSTFVPQTLESWAEVREKALGWRCDAPECGLAPSDDWHEDADMTASDGNKHNNEMLSIYAPSQPAHHEATTGKEFMRLACPHRWHRSCLETLERVSGRTDLAGDEQGRLAVRCALCRKDGWVMAAPPTSA